MVLKLNKALLILSCAFFALQLSAQEEVVYDSTFQTEDTTTYYSETEETPTSDYQEWYHFHNSEQTFYNHKLLPEKFDYNYWKNEKKVLNFEEDTDVIVQEKKKEIPPSKTFEGIRLVDFKFLLIALALILLGIVIYFLLKNSNWKNKKVKSSNILVNFNDLDEQTLRDTELNTPLNDAIRKGDFKTAYRIKYLLVLQQLIGRNLIVYRKEKTNYDYLMQLSGLNMYEPFRMLTFNFDGIWYGELYIDETIYNQLLPYFNTFDATMNSSR